MFTIKFWGELCRDITAFSAALGVVLTVVTWWSDSSIVSFLNRISSENAIEFVNRRGSKIFDARPGEYTRVEMFVVKYRDCGLPKIEAFIENGEYISHKIYNISIVNESGTGIFIPVSKETQRLTYLVQIPESAQPGRSFFSFSIHYPNCPFVDTEIAPKLEFRIIGEAP